MTRLAHICAVLAFAFALLMGAVGGAMAHVDAHGGSADHHGSQHAPSSSAPSHGTPHKAALMIAAPCCPAAEVQTDHTITVPLATVAMSWHPRPDYAPNARDITPDTPPPKTRL